MKYAKSLIGAVLGASVLLSSAVMAENHVIKAVGSKFKPLVLVIAPGDTVSFENMNGHISNTTFTKKDGSKVNLVPAGAEGWMSDMGENFTISSELLTTQGVYLYKCDPHWGNRMGGVIIVGEQTNLDDIEALVPTLAGPVKYLVKKAKKALKNK